MNKRIHDVVVNALVEAGGLDEESFGVDDTLDEDLGLDELDRVEVVMAVEAELYIAIDDEAADACRTVRDLIELTERSKEAA